MAIKAGQKAIYALRCPVSGEVRYIGQSADPRRRLRHHLVEVGKHPHLAKSQWIAGLVSVGLQPELEVLEWVPAGDAVAAERRWIAEFPGLTNCLERAPEHVRKCADALRGRVATATQGVRNPNARLTEEQVREIRCQYVEAVPRKDIAASFATTPVNVWLIGTGRAWTHI